MLTEQNYTTRENKQMQKNVLQTVNPKPLPDSSLMKKSTPNYFLKRLSPFLISVMILPFVTIYTIISNVHLFEHIWAQVIAAGFIEFNLLLFDFALWNYFKGKKVARIWFIELVSESLLFYFML